MLSIHLELLDKKRKTIFQGLKPFRRVATLAGGTALSLQIAHRLSFDFDLFLEREIERRDLLKLKEIFAIETVRVKSKEQLTVITKQGIDITLVTYDYKPLFRRVSTFSVPLYSIKDIATDKAFTVGRRAVWRDYVDLFFILKWKHANLAQVVRWGEKKFGIEFNRVLFLEQLGYFEDLETSKISFVKEKYSPKEIQGFLKEEVSGYCRQMI